MSHTARREGTPEPEDRKQPGTDDMIVSLAKPARKQNVARSDRNQPAQGSEEGIRLQKVLAQAGVASRRHAEILIEQGRVEVDGEVVRVQGMRVDPNTSVIRVDGDRVIVNENMQYFVLNKPRGMLSTMHDDMGRACLGDIVGEQIASGQRLFHVGRLDADTEGLILLTNDGELANRLMHPRYEINKTYLAEVLGEVGKKDLRRLKDGIELDDGIARANYVETLESIQGRSIVRLDIHEGRKHIVRRMLKSAGFPVQRLVRTKIHTVSLGEQSPGAMRALNRNELTSLFKAVGM